jgi:hypothetical protein
VLGKYWEFQLEQAIAENKTNAIDYLLSNFSYLPNDGNVAKLSKRSDDTLRLYTFRRATFRDVVMFPLTLACYYQDSGRLCQVRPVML